jgi:hypothetical protein
MQPFGMEADTDRLADLEWRSAIMVGRRDL